MLQGWARLRVLEVRGLEHASSAGKEAMRTFSKGLRRLPALETLTLHSCGVTDAAAKELAWGLKHSTRLARLSLSRNKIGAAGVAALGDALRGLPRLRELDLSCNPLGDDGAVELARLLGNAAMASVRHVDVESTQFSDEGARALAGLLCAEDPERFRALAETCREVMCSSNETIAHMRRYSNIAHAAIVKAAAPL